MKGALHIGRPRAPDLKALFGRIEESDFDLGKAARIIRNRAGRRPVASGSTQAVPLRLSMQQRLSAARRLPPAIVKVVRNGQTGGGQALRDQLNYLSRDDELSLTNAAGERLETLQALEDVLQMWDVDFKMTNWMHKTTHLLVSSPMGTDPETVWRAADRFAKEMFEGGQGETWDYVKVAHNDTDYPHVHFVVNNLGLETGAQFKVWRTHRINPQVLRTAWASAARAEGLALDDTPRRARGLPPSRMKTPDRKMADEGIVSEHFLRRAVTEVVAASEDRVTRREDRFKRVFDGILTAERDAYKATAETLRAGANLLRSDALRRDADVVDAFADQMTMPHTDGERVVNYLHNYMVREGELKPTALLAAARTILTDSNGEGQRVMAGLDQAHRHSPEEIAHAIQRQIDLSEKVIDIVEDPERRTRLSAELGQEKIKLAALANRPDWSETDNARLANRPVAEARKSLVVLDQSANAERAPNAKHESLGDTQHRNHKARQAINASDASERRILSDADQAALRAFHGAGIDPEAALHRIRYDGPVDRATANRWRLEEVSEAASRKGISETDAVAAVERAHEAAFAAYSQAAKRLRSKAPTALSGDDEAARAVLREQEDVEQAAQKIEQTANRNRKMKR